MCLMYLVGQRANCPFYIGLKFTTTKKVIIHNLYFILVDREQEITISKTVFFNQSRSFLLKPNLKINSFVVQSCL